MLLGNEHSLIAGSSHRHKIAPKFKTTRYGVGGNEPCALM